MVDSARSEHGDFAAVFFSKIYELMPAEVQLHPNLKELPIFLMSSTGSLSHPSAVWIGGVLLDNNPCRLISLVLIMTLVDARPNRGGIVYNLLIGR